MKPPIWPLLAVILPDTCAPEESTRNIVLFPDLTSHAESVRFRNFNPGWVRGDELCCLAPLSMDNLNRLGLRVIADVSPEWHE